MTIEFSAHDDAAGGRNPFAWLIDDHPAELDGFISSIRPLAPDDEIMISSDAAGAGEKTCWVRTGKHRAPPLIGVDMYLERFDQPTFALFNREDVLMPRADQRGLTLITKILLPEPTFANSVIVGISGVSEKYAPQFKKLREQGHRVAFYSKKQIESPDSQGEIAANLKSLGLRLQDASHQVRLTVEQAERIVRVIAAKLYASEDDVLKSLGTTQELLARERERALPLPVTAKLKQIFQIIFALSQMFSQERLAEIIARKGKLVSGLTIRDSLLSGARGELNEIQTEIERQLGGEI